MSGPVWVGREECLAFHEELLARFGGLAGLRDAGLLDSALQRPRQIHAYGTPALPELAAAYAVGIVRNHPFMDGNKRTGFLLAAYFLEVNGLAFKATEESVVLHTLRLAAGEESEESYAAWLDESSA